ncbi:hypothetical protein V1522DRAFT_42219 [Lipomyces starkeyi]
MYLLTASHTSGQPQSLITQCQAELTGGKPTHHPQQLPPSRISTSSTQSVWRYSSPQPRNQRTTNPRCMKFGIERLVALWGVLPSVACQNFGVTEDFLYSLSLAMRFTFQATFNRFTTRLTRPTRHPHHCGWDGSWLSGDNATVRDLPEFRRNGGDPMGCDICNVDLSPYLYNETSFNVAFTKRMSRLQSREGKVERGQIGHINMQVEMLCQILLLCGHEFSARWVRNLVS